jgi:molecular chaperone GrpE (heat shock protein)
MTDRSATKVVFWPFIFVDLVFLGLACLILSRSHKPLTIWESLGLILCVGLGAWSFLTPFLRRNEAEIKLAESQNLTSAVSQIKNLEQIAAQLGGATQNLQTAQEHSTKTISASKEIADKITEESRAFSEFIQKANDSEKNHLRLEVDKLRRAEGDWLQIVVHILDHVFALNRAAIQSGKAPLIQQIGNFQNICCDAARRMGLVCQVPEAGQLFDGKIHQLMEGEPAATGGARLAETLAAGYSYQGRPIRRAVVRLQCEEPAPAEVAAENVENEPAQETLL